MISSKAQRQCVKRGRQSNLGHVKKAWLQTLARESGNLCVAKASIDPDE